MNVQIIEMTGKHLHGPLYDNAPNQIRRAVGRYSDVYVGDRAGTVRDASGKCWDWWETDEALSGGFRKLRIVEAE
jgi:hypothetical protein